MSSGPDPNSAPLESPGGIDFHDVIIIGAGPCGLAVAARLRELAPAAIFTDEEHRRYCWLRKHKLGIAIKHVKSGGVSCTPRDRLPDLDIVVLDAEHSGEWLGRWDRLFSTYDIQHLRSPMFWHMDPGDRDSLLAFAYETERASELLEIRQCVGKELSKHAKKTRQGRGRRRQAGPVEINERERNDYFNPSRTLFSDHSRAVAERYGLASDLIRKEEVTDIRYEVVRGMSVDEEPLFTVVSNKGVRYARAVVLAVGPANKPTIPAYPSLSPATVGGDAPPPPQMCHSMNIECFPAPSIQAKLDAGQPTTILVVGGGLTSAQLSDLAVRRGVSAVWHLMRGPCRVKPFDLDLEWMSKFRNLPQAMFWSADSDEERLRMIRTARGGGSITPVFHKKLQSHISSGKLRLHTDTAIVDLVFQGGSQQQQDGKPGSWIVKTEPPIPDLPPMDYIYFATGIDTNFTSLGYLQSMLSRHPIPASGAFPCLNDDLMWKDGVPLFVTGKLAALRLGPGAANLGGARLGAERIALALTEFLSRRDGQHKGPAASGGPDGDGDRVLDYSVGLGSKYGCLDQEHI